MKTIKAQLLIDYSMSNEDAVHFLDMMYNELKEVPLDYDCCEVEKDNKSYIEFDVVCDGRTYKECETLYKYFKLQINKHFGQKPKEFIKMKLERIC